jgi:osmoprotectant transport system ATP-binding protein
MIQLTGVHKSFDDDRTFAVRDVHLRVHEGEFLVLLGESGCGKTTTLKMINRLVEPSSGTILVNGEDTSTLDPVALRRSIGYVFQGIGLFPHMSVGENVAAVPQLLGWTADRIRARVEELLELVKLTADEFRDRAPADLSGGQAQRVGVARALAASPKVVLMDEPFGALDPITRDNLQREFQDLQKRLGLTVMMVTHDMTEALLMADRIAVMKDGALVQTDTPHALLTQSQDDYVSALLDTPKRQADIVERLASDGKEEK